MSLQLSRRALLAGLPAVSQVKAQTTPRRCSEPTYDLRTGLKPRRVVNAMWDFSWLKSHYPRGPFENWHKVTDELLARGFNTVRLDAFPLVIGALKTEGERITIEAKPLANWGFSDRDYSHDVVAELTEFMRILKQKGIYAILSSWGNTCKEYPDLRKTLAGDRVNFQKSWERTLDALGEKDLLSHVLYVDLDQEFPYFSPFNAELKDAAAKGDAMEQAGQAGPRRAWTPSQAEFVRTLFNGMISHFQARYPALRFTYSLTSFVPEVRALDLHVFDVIEVHLFISDPRLDNRTGFGQLEKDRGQHDYRDYARRLRETMASVRPMLLKQMHNNIAFAKAWGDEIGAPVVTTEAWGPWWHMDHPISIGAG